MSLSRPENSANFEIAPGLIDMHVHFREPGYEYKEDILSGSSAAAAGGFTTVCCMPNTLPAADNAELIRYISRKAEQSKIRVLPIGAVTVGQRGEKLTDFASLKRAGAVALSDDGMPVLDESVMRRALELAKEHDMLIISHCEDEAPMARRDIRLAAELDARIHIAHVSTAKTVDIIRRAKAKGVKVTAETCPHYFSLTQEEITKQGTMAQMNPPLREKKDVEAIIEGLCDGTIDAIATDHAPHSAKEKALPIGKAPNGIIGLETAFAVALTYLYHTGKLGIDDIIRLMSINPAAILGIKLSDLAADKIVFDPNEEWTVDPTRFESKSRNTPYAGAVLRGRVKQTIYRGKAVYPVTQ
ncbi:MAG: dihydroorotase [Oscillospiraceae bacterium]|nr:dihydroorotase [Oscillospiraceae bacterium]